MYVDPDGRAYLQRRKGKYYYTPECPFWKSIEFGLGKFVDSTIGIPVTGYAIDGLLWATGRIPIDAQDYLLDTSIEISTDVVFKIAGSIAGEKGERYFGVLGAAKDLNEFVSLFNETVVLEQLIAASKVMVEEDADFLIGILPHVALVMHSGHGLYWSGAQKLEGRWRLMYLPGQRQQAESILADLRVWVEEQRRSYYGM